MDESPMTAAAVRSIEMRSKFPGWQLRGAGTGHGILGVFEAPAAGPANHWVGANWGGYENPRMQELIERLRTSPAERQQADAMNAISEFAAAELPLLMLYHDAFFLGARQGVKALDDVAGGQGANPLYGGYGRNAHLWDVL